MNTRLAREYLERKKRDNILKLGRKLQLQKELEELESSVSATTEAIEHLKEIKEVLKESSRAAREIAKEKLEKLGTYALQYVFGPDHGFEIEFNIDGRSGTDAIFYFTAIKRGQKVRSRPNGKDGGNSGGGKIILLALALRIAMMQFSDPPIDGPLILDEYFKELDEDRRPLAIKFLLQIMDDFDMQVIAITHDPLLRSMANKKFDFEQDTDGYSIVKEVIA